MASDVVLGAGSGMGEAVARRLAGDSSRLVLADVDVAAVERVAAELGRDVAVCRCDLTDEADLDALAQASGPFRRLVVTAGLSPTMAAGRRIIEVDVIGPAKLIERFGSLAGAGSAAVLLSSMAGHMAAGRPEVDEVLKRALDPAFLDDLAALGVDVDEPGGAYAYSKRGLQLVVRAASKSWGERGARLLTLSPGIIDTPMGRQENEAMPMMDDMVSASALGRMIDPDEVAAVIEFLVSPAASAMTGTDVLVDGGTVAAMMG